MSDTFFDFCQLCNEAFGEKISTSSDSIQQLSFPDAKLEFCARDENLVCRGLVGNLDGIVDLPGCLEALLEGNYLWGGTNGATLSLREDAVYLTDCLPAAYFADRQVLEDYVEEFLHFLRLWRERMNLYKTSGATAREVE